LIIQQVVGETWTVLQAKYLVNARTAEICIDKQHRLRRLHSKTHSQINRSQCLALTMAWAGDAHHIPAIFSKTMHDLGPQNLNGINEGALIVRGHHPPLTKHIE
jgi:hypothetical protein